MVSEEKGAKVLRHDLLTNGIVYADIGFDMRVIPFDLIPLVPLFSRCLTEMGTSKMDDIALSRYIQVTPLVQAPHTHSLPRYI